MQSNRAPTLESRIDELISSLARRVAEELRTHSTEGAYYSQYSGPLPRRAFLALARQGAFPSKKVGKLVLARREVVEQFIDARPDRKASQPAVDDRDPAALLTKSGLTRIGRRP